MQPTIIDGVTPESALFREIFGPVLCVTTFKTEAEAIALANDTPYGLAASVYTGKLNRAIRVSRAIRAGTVTVNCFGEGTQPRRLAATGSPVLAVAINQCLRLTSTPS